MPFIIFVYIKDACYRATLAIDGVVTVGGGRHDTIFLPDCGMEQAQFSFEAKTDRVTLCAKKGVFFNGSEISEAEVSSGDSFVFGEVSVYLCEKQNDYESPVFLPENGTITIGRSRSCEICLADRRVSSRHAEIVCGNGRYRLKDLESKNHTFVNGRRITACDLEEGDSILIGSFEILFNTGSFSFLNTGDMLKLNLGREDMVRRYPFFRRSPRLGISEDTAKIEVQAPPHTGEKPQINWLVVFLPPIVMVGISVAMTVFSEGSLMNLMYILPMSAVTLLTTIISYTAQVRKYRQEKKRKIKSYEKYTDEVIQEIKEAYDSQLAAVNRTNPETAYCYDIVSGRMRRLWERSPEDVDFLDIRLGKGAVPLEKEIVLPNAAVGEDAEPRLSRLQEYVKEMRSVRDIAVTLPLHGAGLVGVVGNRKIAIKAVQNGIVQLVTNHSYADVKLAVIAQEDDYDEWSWTRWLPHTWDGEKRTRFVSSDKKQASELLGCFEEILRKREEASEQNRYQGQVSLPHIVMIITDSSVVENRDFFRLAANPETGMTVFLMFDSLRRLPKECGWFIELGGMGGTVYSRADSAKKTSFALDIFEEYEKFARAMAPIRDTGAVQNSAMPSSVTFYQGYGVKDVSEFRMIRRWSAAKPYETLAVPVGIKENGKPFLFDIHEKAHGPHGLVAGTTGSGKSEVLQTYILSMCLHFPPEAVSFVLIDFKGTGLAGSLKGLPHIAGVITDIDENIQRNLFSLEAEIERRKRLFAAVSGEEKKIQDIYEYQKEYYSGELGEPLSHLIVVIDEFTELKSKFPDFMAAVERASRVGRTLGIHLLLATQKPGGSISDEMRANANFKWCLRVKEGESSEVLGRAEAERIPQEYPGRAYIQVGNNEIFELVQTYYSGAEIYGEEEEKNLRVSFVDAAGRRETVEMGKISSGEERGKELLSIVKYISEEAGKASVYPAKKIWEDSLPKRLSLPELPDVPHASFPAVAIGLVDDPHHQRQYPCVIDFAADGNLIIYGAPGTGKTCMLQTLIVSLARRYTPEEIHIYVMDFGSWSMNNLRELPHIGGIAEGNEEEKLNNLSKMLLDELDRRKALFARSGAGTFSAYREIGGKEIPAVIVAVDHFAPIREMYPDIEDVFVRLSREGSGFGIFLVITAGAVSGSVGYNLTQNCKQALTLWMTEKADYREIVGDTEGLEPEKTAGRGLVRGKPPMEFQAALAVRAENDRDYISELREFCRRAADGWMGSLPREIPVMPDVVLQEHIGNAWSEGIVVGLSEEKIEPLMLPPENRFMLISGTEKSGKTNMIRLLSGQLRKTQTIAVIGTGADEDAERKIAETVGKVNRGEKTALLIDDLPGWLTRTEPETADMLEELVVRRDDHFSLYASGDADELIRAEGGVIPEMIRSGCFILLGSSFQEHSGDFEADNIGYVQRERQMPPGGGYLIWKRKATAFKAIFWEPL